MSTKPISNEAEAALARERNWQAKGLSYSTRRIGALVARLAALNPDPAELFRRASV